MSFGFGEIALAPSLSQLFIFFLWGLFGCPPADLVCTLLHLVGSLWLVALSVKRGYGLVSERERREGSFKI